MSTILKALKKAEASQGKSATPFARASVSVGRSKWLLVPVAICVAVLVYFLVPYVLGPSTAVKTTRTVASFPVKGTALVGSVSDPNSQAVTLINSGKYKEAENLLRGAVDEHPEDPYLRNDLGFALKKQDRPSEAIAEYEKAIELKTDYYIAMNNLAVALEAAGEKTRAAEMYKKALTGDPAMSGAHLNYALLLENQGKLDEAENHYRTFLTLSTDEDLKSLVRKRLRAFK